MHPSIVCLGERVPDAGSQYPVGGSVHPDVLRDRQVLLWRVQQAQVPHKLQQAQATVKQLQGKWLQEPQVKWGSIFPSLLKAADLRVTVYEITFDEGFV